MQVIVLLLIVKPVKKNSCNQQLKQKWLKTSKVSYQRSNRVFNQGSDNVGNKSSCNRDGVI